MVTTSVIIPAHNEERYLPHLLRSLARYGPQNAEIIVVDNGSTDRTAQIAATFNARVVACERVYPGIARNVGARAVGGDILVFLDADVELTEEWQKTWVECERALTVDPWQLFGSICDISRDPSRIERIWFAPMRKRKRSHVDGANIIMSRQLFEHIGGFDESLETGEDVELCQRVRASASHVTLCDGLKVYHNGYPRTVIAFIKRERWHGRGDLGSLRCVVKSKVVIATVLFAVFNLGALVALCIRDWVGQGLCDAGIFCLCVLGAKRATGSGRLQAIALAYCYYIGRLLSIISVFQSFVTSPRRRDATPGHCSHRQHWRVK